ncbi:hypothetical protein HY605_02470 [Candidatus Peregrinibacteria bacterium]|nr:hypothetical protein [Candidatus Peregrinibacteria bacterium]
MSLALFAVSLIVVLDIFTHAYDRRFYSEEISPAEVYDLPEELALIESLNVAAGGQSFRISDEMNFFEQNKWEYYGVENVWGNGGIKIAEYNDLFERLDRLHWKIKDEQMYDLLNVRYVITDRDMDLKHFEKLDENIYLNKEVLPRVYFEGGGSVTILKKEPNYLKLAVSYDGQPANRLMLSEIAYTGWLASIDGVAFDYQREGVLRYLDFYALGFKEGAYVVEFSHRPLSVYLGALISGISVLLLLVTGVFHFKKKND